MATGLWIVYREHPATGQRDELLSNVQPKYSDITVYNDELTALRFAVASSLKCREVKFGEALWRPPARHPRD